MHADIPSFMWPFTWQHQTNTNTDIAPSYSSFIIVMAGFSKNKFKLIVFKWLNSPIHFLLLIQVQDWPEIIALHL